MEKIKLIVIAGATASGKTSLSVKLASRFGGEIISADSMQIYKGMDIATAKPTPEEREAVVHHMIDFLDTSEKYSVARYVKQAADVIKDVHDRGRLPFLVGGTGLYIDSLLNGISFKDEPDNTDIRKMLNKRLADEGIQSLWNELESVDKQTADSLHINNTGRIIRALEVWYLTGETMSERVKKSREKPSAYDSLYMMIDFADRQLLYNRINRRVDEMLENGLVEEAREYVRINREATASQAIGYKELEGYFKGDLTLEQAVENLKSETRHYAKRQLTWFRRNPQINVLSRKAGSDEEEIFDEASKLIEVFLKGSADNG